MLKILENVELKLCCIGHRNPATMEMAIRTNWTIATAASNKMMMLRTRGIILKEPLPEKLSIGTSLMTLY